MLHGFELLISNDEKQVFLSRGEYKEFLALQKTKIKESLDELYLEDGSIDAEKMQNAWFPSMSDMHVFISHSHKDASLAETLACWLYENYNIKSFLDSHVWGYSNTLLNKLDMKYAYSKHSNTYNYQVRNLTTSHVHMMLSSALSSMIDSCECLLFINTNNSIANSGLTKEITDDRTPSPWIMFELMLSSTIRRHVSSNRRSIALESLQKSAGDSALPTFLYTASKEHLKKVNAKQLSTWHYNNKITKSTIKQHEQIEFKALDSLYDHKFEQN
ncbi:hypothetical protein ACEUAF_19450 [Aeromonas veronii]